MASSLRAGLEALDPACTAALVVLGDGPALAAEAIRRVAVAAEGADGLVSARYGDHNGHPVAIPRPLWAQLPSEGEQGARVLGKPALLVDCSDLPAPGDADTPADLL
jgi:CTP:molybdopterin cytidylyltransferase MocA